MLFTAISMAALAQDTAVVQLEYFFDADQGVGNNTLVNVTPAADGTFPFTANIAGLNVGYHKLYIRTKDSNGKWSFTARRNVQVFASDAKTSIVSGEYFIDADPGFGSATPITVTTPDSVILQNFSATTAGLSVGYHKLYGRFKDNLGRWSLTLRRNIEIYNSDTNYVKNAEYFFKTDNGYGNCTEVKLANPSVDGTFSFNIPLSAIPAGADTLFIRVRDSSENKWSITIIKNISVALPLTLLNFNVVKQNNTAQLNWQTANEINTAYFNVQRSIDGRNFTNVGKVIAKGSSKVNNEYAYIDDIAQLHSDKIYYRLQIIDNDGKLNYSAIKYINVNGGLSIAIIPNPIINNKVNLNIYSTQSAKLQLDIYNQLGQQIFNQQFNMQSGSLNKVINLSNLASGSYLVRVTDGSSIQTLKFIKQ